MAGPAEIKAVITAKTDGFETALNRAAKATEEAAARIKGATDSTSVAVGVLKGALSGIAASLTVDAFVGLIKGAIDSADKLNDLSTKTGVAVETLGGLGYAAQVSGGSLETITSGLSQLNITLAKAASGNARAKEAFDLLGVAVKDAAGNTRAADQVLLDLSTKFSQFNDGPEKSALALRLFKGAGEALIPTLNEGATKLQENVAYFERYSGVTAELAEKAGRFNDTLDKLSLLSGAFGKQLAAQLLPTLQEVADVLVESKEKGTLFHTAAEGIGMVFAELVIAGAEVVKVFNDTGTAIGGLVAKADALLHLDFAGFRAISDAVKDDAAAAEAALDAFRNRTRARLAGREIDFGRGNGFDGPEPEKKDAPRLKPTGGGAKAGVDLQKKELDAALKALDNYIASEKERLSARNDYLRLYYQDDQTSIRDYFEAREAARQEDLANTRRALQEEAALLERDIQVRSRGSDDKSKAAVIDDQNKLIAVQAKLRKTEEEAARARLSDTFAAKRATEAYTDSLKNLDAQLATIRGNTAQAFTISFDIQTRGLRDKIDAVLQSTSATTEERQQAEAARENLGQLRQQGVVTATLNDLEKQRSAILTGLQNAQERVNIAASSGRATELESLQAASEANRSRLAGLQALAEAYDRIAQSSKDPFDRVRADSIRVELERIAAQTDLVADKFREIGRSATENFIDKITSGTATVKDAFKGLVKDINAELLKIGARELSQQIFKRDGAIGSAISQIFGGVGGAAQSSGGAAAASTAAAAATSTLSATTTAANDAAFAALTASVTGADASIVALNVSLPIADGALSSLAASAGLAAAAMDAIAARSAANTGSSLAAAAVVASAKGNVFARGNVIPFAQGGVLGGPTYFPLRNGDVGLGGEAGPEALVPLRRGRDGRLGVDVTGEARAPRSVKEYHFHYTPTPGESRATTSQRASEFFRAGQAAMSRNG